MCHVLYDKSMTSWQCVRRILHKQLRRPLCCSIPPTQKSRQLSNSFIQWSMHQSYFEYACQCHESCVVWQVLWPTDIAHVQNTHLHTKLLASKLEWYPHGPKTSHLNTTPWPWYWSEHSQFYIAFCLIVKLFEWQHTTVGCFTLFTDVYKPCDIRPLRLQTNFIVKYLHSARNVGSVCQTSNCVSNGVAYLLGSTCSSKFVQFTV